MAERRSLASAVSNSIPETDPEVVRSFVELETQMRNAQLQNRLILAKYCNHCRARSRNRTKAEFPRQNPRNRIDSNPLV